MSSKNRHDRELESLLDAIDLSVIAASDSEILEDARIAGVDPVANAQALRARFLAAARNFQKRKLVEARKVYTENVQKLTQVSVSLPVTAHEQRVLLQLVIAQNAQQGLALTAKYRDFESIPDSDLPDLLQELAALDLLPKKDAGR